MTVVRFKNQPIPGFNNLLDSFFERPFGRFPEFNQPAVPAVNIRQDAEHWFLEVAAPGLKKEDFNLTLDKDTLTISSEIENEVEEKENEYTRKEFTFQSFSRSFTLPETVQADKINAKYEHGVLIISIPKKEEAKELPARKIEIA